jgi:hypothetical protein
MNKSKLSIYITTLFTALSINFSCATHKPESLDEIIYKNLPSFDTPALFFQHNGPCEEENTCFINNRAKPEDLKKLTQILEFKQKKYDNPQLDNAIRTLKEYPDSKIQFVYDESQKLNAIYLLEGGNIPFIIQGYKRVGTLYKSSQ